MEALLGRLRLRPLRDGSDFLQVLDGEADLARDGLREPLLALLAELLRGLLAALHLWLVALLAGLGLLYLLRRGLL